MNHPCRMLVSLGLSAVLAGGCKSRPSTPADDSPVVDRAPTTVPVAKPSELLKKPAIDLSHGGAGFPLETKVLPTNAGAIVDALRAGYALRLTDSDHVNINAAAPATGLAFEGLSIDISGSSVKPDFVPKEQADKHSEPVASVKVGDLRYTADPLHYQGSSASLRLAAAGAELAMIPASDGSFGLSLTDCVRAAAKLKLSQAGLRQSLSGAIKVHRSMAFEIDSVDLHLSSDSPRNLSADVMVHASVLLMPATFRLTGRTDIDDAFNVHFSNLNAEGKDPAGAVVAGLIQIKLDKLNGHAAPLLKLPGDRIKINALAIHVDDDVTVDVGLKGSGR